MNNFTPEDLLLYLYNESPAAQKAAISAALASDWSLREKMSVLKASMQRLDKIIESPRTEVVLQVLHYAEKHEAQEV